MEEDSEPDDLPPVCVPAAATSSRFKMPSAGELAGQRARAERLDAELRRAANSDHSDGEEDELADVAATLRLRAPAPASAAAPLAALLRAAAPLLPAPRLLDRYTQLAPPDRPAPVLAAQLVALLTSAAPSVRARQAAAAGACLCLALVSAESAQLSVPRCARAAQLALHALPDDDVGALADALATALPRAEERLCVADTLRGGARQARALADALEASARAAGGAAAELELRLAGRARARSAPHAWPPLPAPPRDHRPDSLKAQMMAAKLLVLFPPSAARAPPTTHTR